MKFLLEWISDFVSPLPPAQDLAAQLTDVGFEVEAVIPFGTALDTIISGKIMGIDRHPNADRLVICTVSTGATTHQIVTGATNVAPGQMVPVCLPGSRLADGTVLKKSKLRGVESNGMLCSRDELGIGNGASTGIWILPPETAIGIDLITHAKLTGTILDINILPNRPDCMSVIGIAREIGARLNTPLINPYPSLGPKNHPANEVVHSPEISTTECLEPQTQTTDSRHVAPPDLLQVTVTDPEFCPLYIGQIIPNVTITDSPLWMQRRLETVGIRAINVVVDITNYVMVEQGQPLHAFDYRSLHTNEITVGRLETTASGEFLDNTTREISPTIPVISSDGTPLAVAGIMGLASSGISESTQTIVLESAVFSSTEIRKASKALGIRTDSSQRFERGIPADVTQYAHHLAGQLIAQLAGGELKIDRVIIGHDAKPSDPIPFNTVDINRRLGTAIPAATIENVLQQLGFWIVNDAVHVPKWRSLDIKDPADLSEEIIRFLGIDKQIPKVHITPAPILHPDQSLNYQLRCGAVSAGLMETISMPLVDPEIATHWVTPESVIHIQNPVSVTQSALRPNILLSLLQNLQYNRHRNQRDLGFFESGVVFRQHDGQYHEHTQFGITLWGNRLAGDYMSPSTPWELPYIRGLAERLLKLAGRSVIFLPEDTPPNWANPHQILRIMDGTVPIGYCGLIHPLVAHAWDLTGPVGAILIELNAIPNTSPPPSRFIPFSKYPSIRRDIALSVPTQYQYATLIAAISSMPLTIQPVVTVFDAYRDTGAVQTERNIGLSLNFQHDDRSLTDDEIGTAVAAITEMLTTQFPGLTLR